MPNLIELPKIIQPDIQSDLLARQLSEHRRIQHAVGIEATWWGGSRRYTCPESAIVGYADGDLQEVGLPNDFFTSPSDIRAHSHLRYLRPSAYRFVMSLFEELDSKTTFSKQYLYCLSSFLRTEHDQGDISQSSHWYRAAQPGASSHAFGTSFDISVRSHYVVTPDGLQPARLWDDTRDCYNPQLFVDLSYALEARARQGLCNFVVENVVDELVTAPTCFHVCVSPNF